MNIFNNPPDLDDQDNMADDKEYADRWVGDVVIGTTGTSLCIRPSEAKKAMGLMRGETVRIVIWRAPPNNKLPKESDTGSEEERQDQRTI